VVAHSGDKGAGKITEPGAFVEKGSTFHNITIRRNTFLAQAGTTPMHGGEAKPWPNSFMHIGIVDGLTIESNRMAHADGSFRVASDMVLYGNSRMHMSGNTCFNGSVSARCDVANTTRGR
jgi:hypothetical protein